MNDNKKIDFLSKIKQVDVLLVGESRPAGGTYFYERNSILYKEINKELAEHIGADILSFDCLDFFNKHDIFLDDLNEEPVNQMTDEERNNRNHQAVPRLADRIKLYNPRIIIGVMKRIDEE